MIYFRHRLPTADEITTIKLYFLIQEDDPWNTTSFSDQVAHNFYQQVIETENYNASSANLPDTSAVNVNQNNSRLSFYDPLDLVSNNFKGKTAH
jgi:hypothetical protein